MHLNKNHTFSRRALAMLLTLTLCFSLVPSAFAAQQNSYHDPAEHWMQASNRTNELDVNSVVTRETFKCGECGKVTSFEAFRVPEYTRNGQTALSRNVKYSDGTMMDGVGKGDCMDGVPGKDAHYTGYGNAPVHCPQAPLSAHDAELAAGGRAGDGAAAGPAPHRCPAHTDHGSAGCSHAL